MADLNPLKFKVAIIDEATTKLNEIEEKFSKLKDKTISVKVEGLDQLQQLLSALQHTQVQNIGRDVGASINEATRNLQSEAQKAIRDSLGKLATDLVSVKEAIQHDNFTAFSTRITKCAEAVDTLDAAFKKFHVTIGQDEGMRNFMTGLGEVIRNVRTTMGVLNGGMQGLTAAPDAMARSIKVAQHEAARLNNELTRAQQVIETLGNKGFDVSNLERYIKALNEVRENLRLIETNGGVHPLSGLTASQYLHGDDVSRVVSLLRSEMTKLTADANKAGMSIHQFATEEERLAQAVVKSTSEMFSQSQILSDLKSMATQYLGVWGAQQFLNNIIQIGGQLEMQRLSIGAILGDAAQANDLFEKIKGLAIQSPFGVVELDQMTKQLTAYGFEYHELFDMTKRLADISAATGTGVDRLALALGHVRSEAALSGYTLRQFSMANIPLAQKLSDRLSEIEKRFVSVAEVRKRVSKKEIGYEDVVAVLKELTDEGGMFYNAQEIMSGSVKAKFKNLKDAMDIMYGEMAESKLGDSLKEVANILTTLTRKWEELGAAIAVVAGAWAIKKGATFLSSNALLAYSDGVTRLRMNLGSLTAEEMRELAYSNNLTKQRLLEAVATGKVTIEDAKLAAAKWGLTEAQLQEVAMGKRTVASMTANSIATSKYSMAQLRAIATTRQFALFGSKSLAVAMNVIAANAKMAGTALLSFAKSLWPVALITAGVEAWMHYRQQGEQAGEAAASAFTKGEEAVRNLQEALDKLPTSVGLDDGALRNGIKEAVKELKNYNPAIVNDIIAKANKTGSDGKPIMSLAEQYDYLRGKVEETRKELEEFQRTSSAQESALKATGGVLNDNVFGDINNYFDSRKEFIEDTNNYYAKYKAQVRTAVDAAREEDEAFRNATTGMSNYAEMLRLLVAETDEAGKKFDFSKGFDVATNTIPGIITFRRDWSDGRFSVLGQGEEMKKELDNWANGLKAQLEGSFGYDFSLFGKDFSEKTRTELNNVRRHIWEFTESEELSKLDEETRKWIRDYLGRKWNITFSTNAEQVLKDFDEMQHHIEGLVGKDWVIKLKLQSVGSFEEEYDQLNKNVKEAKETMKKLGTSFSDVERKSLESTVVDDSRLTQKQKEYHDAWLKLKNSKDAAIKEGFKLDALEDKKSGGGKRSAEDVNAKAVRERVRIIKEAADAFQYWREKVGDKSAWAHVEEEFGSVLNDINVTADNIKDLKGNLANTLNSMEFNAIKDKKLQREIKKEVAKDTAQIDRKEFEKTAEGFASKVQIELDSLTRAWDIFNNVREATGNVELAVKISGAEYAGGKTRNLADALREKIQRDFDAAGGGIAFDINLSDKQIEEAIKNAVPKASEIQSKGLVEEYKKWRDLQRDVLKSDIDVFSKLIGGAKNYESELQQINDKLEKQIESNNQLAKNGTISRKEADRANNIARVDAESEKWEKSLTYTNLLNNSLALTREEVENGINRSMDILNEKLHANTITAKEYADEIAKIRKIQSDWVQSSFFGKNSAFGAGIMGGISGRRNYLNEQLSIVESAFSALQQKMYKRGLTAIEADKMNDSSDKRKEIQEQIEYLDNLENMTNSFAALSKAMDPVITLFEQLGMTGLGRLLSGAQSALSNASTMGVGAELLIPGAGMYGAFIGAGISIFNSVFAEHDKKQSELISVLNNEISALEKNTESIKASRARGLGYDGGDEIRRALLQQYRKDKTTILYDKGGRPIYGGYDKSVRAMRDYYSDSTNGYSQELKNLESARKAYMEMYNLESAKKDSSQASLDEYKQKIAELDEQIMYFTEDLAKELWDIDIKGWASQISDALWTAFENGEDAVKAFGDTTKDIVSDVAKKMMNLHLIEPMFKELEDELFGKIDENGNRTGGKAYSSGVWNETATLEILGRYFGEDGEFAKVITSAEDFYKLSEKASGMTFASDSSKTTSSSSKVIQGGFSEDETGLLLSYMNGMRGDLSLNRAAIVEYFSLYYDAITSGNASLRNIENHTAAIMKSNASIEKSNQSILDRIDGLRNKSWIVPVS